MKQNVLSLSILKKAKQEGNRTLPDFAGDLEKKNLWTYKCVQYFHSCKYDINLKRVV